MVSRAALLSSAQGLISDFSQKEPIDRLLSHFSRTHACEAFEHGEPCLAPFLGRPFSGLDQIRRYFAMLQDYLTYENMTFDQFCVDAESRRVSCVGKAKFTWVKPNPGDWNEIFHYLLDFDDSPEPKITNYQVWADSGAAYLAGRGELSKVRESTDTNKLMK
ncbi:hypothetical protein PUNSTDRAFT_73269 [Punctularia strigosozonata HHB-11173 SS5]|uniref:uncharacterized protein n=1 Tax=Punctularia strigosozonata (strain HHB-11173) TaxID=741275 RepID=UPI0004417614|nr:uncharacterized protein PUNSTDRAFT_73269 [Punctularia strigosozonata HHB-11173 SS5]EIN05988.1 hypothetical protein PUNSTDRAFT_73269 [Punctularia strigosozonata HHB-11173 SS5]